VAEARTFLEMARKVRFERDTPPLRNPIVAAYFRAVDEPGDAIAEPVSGAEPEPTAASADGLGEQPPPGAALVDVLIDAGVLPHRSRALLEAPSNDSSRFAAIHAFMAEAGDAAAFAGRNQELAFLANAILSGCSMQARPFTAPESQDAALATCNLGLELWPRGWPPPADLVSAFQVGWTHLYEDVVMVAADRLLEALDGIRVGDPTIQAALAQLQRGLSRHLRAGAPWRSRDDLDVLATLDLPSWAAILSLIDEYPTLHAAIRAAEDPAARSMSGTAAEFIGERRQIDAVQGFMASVADRLR
jgi:hypothetical protein